MWSPRRILLLGASFVLLLMGYVAYGFSSVGRIDGLPPLPQSFWKDGEKIPDGRHPERLGPSELEKRLKTAFGPDCDELRRAIRLDIRSRGMLLAAEQFEITKTDDGRVILSPLSVALFSKDSKSNEISTVRSNVGYIKFDRPVTTLSEIANRKMVAMELSGRIEIVNNRKRLQRDQDLRINIPIGPLYYDEPTRKVWTHDDVQVVDHKAGLKPHVIKGKGMEMELAAEPAGQDGKPRDSISGVKWVALNANVDMELHLAGKDGFFDASAAPLGGAGSKPTAPKTTPKKSQINIVTAGKFRYDMHKGFDTAVFDAPPRTIRSKSPSQVHVVRQTDPPNGRDQLICTRLALRLRRAEATPTPVGTPKKEGDAARIETMHATGPEREVVITSDSERLEAVCADFFHNADKGVTVLKGRIGMSVKKQDNEIHARDLAMTRRPVPVPVPGHPPAKESYDVRSQGPGRLMFKEGKEGKPMKASWSNLLTMTRDGVEDLVTLVGDAKFEDLAMQQTLSADILKVWLDPEEKKSTPVVAAPGEASATGRGRKPRHLEATGSVVVRSKDMNIHDSSRLVLWFRDVEAPPGAMPSRGRATPSPSAAPPQPVSATSGPAVAPRNETLVGGMPPLAPVPKPAAAPTAAPPPRPYDISARSIEAKVLRSPVKNTIDVLTCEGAVVVRQEPARPTEKGTDIRGETLRMTAAPENLHILVVTGDMAELQTDKILILGPEVTINQYTNMAWVVGDGAMRMESATNFQGDKLETAQPLNVHWNRSMVFNGTTAEFVGNIQATQAQSKLACQHMVAHFDKPVSLREGNRSDKSAKVKQLVCDKQVRVEETVQKNGRLEKYQRLESIYMRMYALDPDEPAPGKPVDPKANGGNKVIASGPGVFRVTDRGEAGPLDLTVPGEAPPTPRAGAPAKAKPTADEFRLTHVRFVAQMHADSKTGIATFWKDVRVLHLPVKSVGDDPDMDKVLAAELPERGMYLQCDNLKVLDRPTNGKPNKRMEGRGNVRVLGRDFRGNSDKIFYDQQKDQIIFEGGESGPAELQKVDVPGAKPQRVSGKTIIYNRAKREIKVEGGDGVSGTSTTK